MTIKIVGMEMPKSCSHCEFLNISARYVTCVARKGELVTNNVSERPQDCPLQPVEEIKGTISTEDYMKFYEKAEELCKRNPGIKDFEDFNKALRENK